MPGQDRPYDGAGRRVHPPVHGRGGEKISAEEVENLVYRLPAVSQVAAVAMPDPELGERVCLFVVARGPVTLEEIRTSMQGVARFKLPERLEIVDELPSTKVGKIDKKALRARLAGSPTPPHQGVPFSR